MHTTNFCTTKCQEQCSNITWQDSYYILGAKTEQNIFIPCYTITEKDIAFVRLFNLTLPLRLAEIEFKNNRCCSEVCKTSDSTVEFQFGHKVAYFDAR